jgi:hypothetical protein
MTLTYKTGGSTAEDEPMSVRRWAGPRPAAPPDSIGESWQGSPRVIAQLRLRQALDRSPSVVARVKLSADLAASRPSAFVQRMWQRSGSEEAPQDEPRKQLEAGLKVRYPEIGEDILQALVSAKLTLTDRPYSESKLLELQGERRAAATTWMPSSAGPRRRTNSSRKEVVQGRLSMEVWAMQVRRAGLQSLDIPALREIYRQLKSWHRPSAASSVCSTASRTAVSAVVESRACPPTPAAPSTSGWPVSFRPSSKENALMKRFAIAFVLLALAALVPPAQSLAQTIYCTSDDDCPTGQLCCYPCGIDGCQNVCMTPWRGGECPVFP